MRRACTAALRWASVALVLSLAWGTAPGALSGPGGPPDHVRPAVRITSPEDGAFVPDGRVDVTVEFRARRGNVKHIELLVGDAVADELENPPQEKSGEHTFQDVDLSRLGGAVEIRARAYQGDREADLSRTSEPVLLVLDPSTAALRRLAADSEIEPIVHVVEGLPRSTEVRVPFDPDLSEDPVVQALAFLDRYGAAFGAVDPADLHLEGVSEDEDGTHLFFSPHRDGIGLFAGQVGVHVRDGYVVGTGGHFQLALPDLPEAEVSREEAEDAAMASVPGTAREVGGGTRLVYLAPSLLGEEDPGTHLTWRVTVRGERVDDGAAATWLAFVDAHSGDVIFVVSAGEDHQRPGEDMEVYEADRFLRRNCYFDSSFDVDQTHDEDGPVTDDDPPAGTERLFERLHAVYRHHADTFGRLSADGLGGMLKATANVPDYRNAYWDPDCGELVFGAGYEVLDTVAHELQHAVGHYSPTPLVYANQSGALDESYADVAGAMVDDEDWLLGEDKTVARPFCQGSGHPPGTSRDMADPPKCGQPDHMGDFADLPNTLRGDWGGVHINSGIPNKAAYLLAEGGTHKGVSVDGIGRERVALLYDAAQINRVDGNAEFRDARNATVAIARDWASRLRHGFDAAAACSTVNAFAAVGLGTPDSDCDGVSDAEEDGDPDGDGVFDPDDNCPEVPNPLQRDADEDGEGDACTDDDDGDGTKDFFDNCPRVPNAAQGDEDGDGFGDACDVEDVDGDGIDDAGDNCVRTPNARQVDTDDDGKGDACDLDDDDDGVLDEDDNCRLTFNPRQRDQDGDGVGDACDNCEEDPNPEQADTDENGEGNVCDPDDDGDGVLDGDDNCRLVANSRQTDIDGNGTGTACDPGEIAMLSGDVFRELRGTIRFGDTDEGRRLPVRPCLADGCPDWLASDVVTAVDIESTQPVRARVVDDRGFVVAHGSPTPEGALSISFRPKADTFFRSPLSGEVFEGTGYFLELLAGEGVGEDEDVGVEIDVESRGTGFAAPPPDDGPVITEAEAVNEQDGAVDEGDTHEFVFDRSMDPELGTSGTWYEVTRSDVGSARITCGETATCSLQSEDADGEEIGPDRVLLVTLTVTPSTQQGEFDYPVEVTSVSSAFVGAGGSPLDLDGSPDREIECACLF